MHRQSYEYITQVLSGEKDAPKYVKKQCELLKPIYEDKDKKYVLSKTKAAQVDGLLKLLVMPKGLETGKTLYESLVGFQFFLLISVLCIVHRDDPEKRRYTKLILEICRKNAKTFIVAVIFILLFFLEPKFARFYSVAPDGSLSREIKDMMESIIKSSPYIEDKMIIRRDDIFCKLTENKFVPLNYTNSRFDGKLPSVYVADEVGALPNNYAIEAMQSGQLTIKNKLGCIISTKYPRPNNPLEDEVDYAKKVLDGIVEDETILSLLYEPDNKTDWETDNMIIRQGNPLAIEVPEILEEIYKLRQKAIEVPSARENFVTKHCNIVYTGVGTETYIDVQELVKGKIDQFDWTGRDVYIGLDLAMTTDNCSVAMLTYDENLGVISQVMPFIPVGRIETKTVTERVDYYEYIKSGHCEACGDLVVDYLYIEDYILKLEERYGVNVIRAGYDRYNAMSTAQKLEDRGIETVEVKQHSSVLHRPTKWLEELILNGKFKYLENKLLEINFANAKCQYDTNMNRYVTKKKSNGKVDIVFSILDALYLLQLDVEEQMSWGVQVI